MNKSLLQFEATIKTEATKDLYKYTLNKFCEFAGIAYTEEHTVSKKRKDPKVIRHYDYDAILKIPNEELSDKLIMYIAHLKDLVSSGNLNANSVPKYFNGIEHFLIMNDRVFNWAKLHKMYPAKRKEAGSEAYSTEQIQQIFSYAKSARTKFIVLFLCSTGARIGALEGIKLKHIKKIKDCYYVTLYAGAVEEAVSFLTPEASKAYETYIVERERDGEKFTPDSPLFRSEYRLGIEKVHTATKKALEAIVYRLVQKAVIIRTKEGTRYNIQVDHGFRKWFKIQVANTEGIPLEMSKKLIQHKDLEGKYNVPNPEQLFVHFQKVIPSLTIDDSARKQALLEIKDKEITDLRAKDTKIAELDKKYDLLVTFLQANPQVAAQLTGQFVAQDQEEQEKMVRFVKRNPDLQKQDV